MNKRKKVFINNLIYAFAAQGLSFVLSVLMSVIVPKVLSLNDFGSWQLFIFYTSYVGFFHFGFNDGVYLLNGGKKYEELNFEEIGGAFWISFIIQLLLGCGLGIFSCFINIELSRRIVLFCTIVYMLVFNSSFCLGYIFQAVNDTKKYSKSVMVDKACFMIALVVLLLFKIDNFIWFIVCYIIAKVISYIYCIYYGKKIFFVRKINVKKSIKCYIESVSVGFNLTIAGVASMLILGIGRLIIDSIWGIEEFAKFSLVLSLASFAIMFISQVSMVLFPSLRQISSEEQKTIYYKFRCVLSIGLPMLFVICIPLKVIMQIWLPQYANSLNYLILALPICFFDAKMNLLCNTYFKVLREEKYLRKINIFSFVFSLLLCGISGYIFKNSIMVLLSMVCAVAFRSIVSEIHLARIMKHSIRTTLTFEVLFVVCILIFSIWLKSDDIILFVLSIILYLLFLLFNKESVQVTKNLIRGMINGKKNENSMSN